MSNYETWTGRFADRYGDRQVSDLRPDDFEAWLAELRSGGLTATTAAHAHTVVGVMMNQAVRWQIIPASPTRLVTPPRPDTRERKV